MAHLLNTFLATEITCIPKILDRYMGKYYSNTISNGATWLFFIWTAVHFIFEECINIFLKKVRLREYIRTRLKRSIWYLVFYCSCFFYCTVTLYKNNVEIFRPQKFLNGNTEVLPGYLIFGFLVLCTFYAHTVIWEGLRNGFSVSTISYTLLIVFILITYIIRRVELSLSLLTIVSFSRIGIELVRCITTLQRNDSQAVQILSKKMLCAVSCLFVLTHLIIIPLFFLFPLGHNLMWKSKTGPAGILNCTLWLWLLTELIDNPLFKFLNHWIYHNADTSKIKCPGLTVECSLFQPRDDDAYNLLIIKQEIKDREARMLSLRKPKNRSMLIQTLKCVVALKKKLKEKRSAENSDSDDSESENKDNEEQNSTPLDESENTNLVRKYSDFNIENKAEITLCKQCTDENKQFCTHN